MTSSTNDFMDFDFAGSMQDVKSGCLLKPILHNYLFDAKFPEFSLHFEKQEMERKPDGWFHPSTHPLWKASTLFMYLAHPETFPVEKKQYMSTLSVTIGKIMHEFIGVCLRDAGVLPEELQQCTTCPPPKKGQQPCNEPGFSLPEIGDRGHLDGLLDFSSLGPSVPDLKRFPIFEMKTTNDNFGKLGRIEDMDLEAFKTKWPVYWAQQQRYQRMTGRRWSVVLMMEMGYPWLMREFHVPYDEAFNQEIDAKYLAVKAAAEGSGQQIFCCRQKGCPAWDMCRHM